MVFPVFLPLSSNPIVINLFENHFVNSTATIMSKCVSNQISFDKDD